MELNQLFIINLKRWRKATGLSQKGLAEKCGAAHSYIRQLESGKGYPSFAFIGKIATALQIEPYQLFFDGTLKTNKSAQRRYMESLQKKLILTISDDINSTFDELKKYQ